MDVSIIVINYNTPELTFNCIESVFKQTKDIDFEVILVDNCSTQFDCAFFQESFPALHIIESPTNSGFAKGNNSGIAAAKGKWICLLNSDTLLLENSILKLVQFWKKTPTIGAVTPRICFPDGRPQSVAQRFPSVRYGLIELFRLHRLFSKQCAGKLLLGAFFDQGTTVEADWIWGTCFFTSKSIIASLPDGKLNDDYFMYCEDMQWCYDISKTSHDCYFYAGTTIHHLMGGSSAKKEELNAASFRFFMAKNYSHIHRKLIQWVQFLLAHSQK
jgi:GT2 family glycosyltransferase